jgi:hypothetical protein
MCIWIPWPLTRTWESSRRVSIADMVRVSSISVVVLAGVSLGLFGPFLGYKLSRYRPHRQSEEIQTILTRNKLDSNSD